MPMQPRPRAETFNPLLPNNRCRITAPYSVPSMLPDASTRRWRRSGARDPVDQRVEDGAAVAVAGLFAVDDGDDDAGHAVGVGHVAGDGGDAVQRAGFQARAPGGRAVLEALVQRAVEAGDRQAG